MVGGDCEGVVYAVGAAVSTDCVASTDCFVVAGDDDGAADLGVWRTPVEWDGVDAGLAGIGC